MVELLPTASHITGPTWQKTTDGKWYLPEKSLGWQVIDWIAEYVNSPAGDHAGQAFMPTLEQARFMLWWYAVDEEGKFIYREGCLRRMKGPIAHYTPVATPTGWVKHGDLKIGDIVYAVDGTQTEVVDVKPDVLEDTYRITFRDGSTVDCTGSHRWPLTYCLNKKTTQVEVTVLELIEVGNLSRFKTVKTPFSEVQTIVSIERIDSTPAKCITVAHESHIYLVGSSNIPTCNSGKDVVAAALALVELCGPVVFSGWDAKGNPIAKPRHAAWVTVAAVSLDQSKNTFSLFPVMISKKMKQTYGMEVNKFIIYSAAGGRLEAASSSPASLEGNRPTFLVQNEVQYWGAGPGGEYNNGHEMAAVIEGNITKVTSARILSICNAHIPGNDSVGERIYKAWEDIQAGKAVDTGLLYDALEAPADTPISEIPSESVDPEGYAAGVEKLREGLMIARGDSYWLPVDEILKSVLDVKNSITESRRKFLNQVNASEDSWIAPYEWDVCLKEDVEPLQLGDRVALGFDGSKSNDHTALCVCRISDGALFLVRTWVPGNYSNGEIPRDDVDAYVRSMFEKYDVVVFRADVKEFEAYVDQWSRDFKKKIKVNASPGHPIAFDMRGNQKKFAFDCERFLDAVLEQELIHDGNPVLRQHVLNAKRNPTTWDAISIRKTSRDSPRKIDAAVTAVLAWGARQEYLVSKNNKSQGGRVFK